MRRAAARVIETEEIYPGTFVTWYDAPALTQHAQPGQFVMVDPGAERGAFDPLLPRAFSYYRFRHASTGDSERQFALLYTVIGRVTEQMASMQPGERAWMTGPLGRGFDVRRTASNLLLVGGGVGIAPLVALADAESEQSSRSRSIVLCFGARSADGVYPAELLPPQVEYQVATEDGSMGRQGFVTELFADYLSWADQSFACGPVPMFRAMTPIVRRDGMNRPVQILMETEMACGTGICYGCAVFTKQGVKLCCKDGPRFELLDVYPNG
ncbi:MAG: dihydroorotate dehydrogenase electron transfer subunit [Chloroflexota bacterium]|nr:dihydroorotate dehydrogenase electron transfer subunit [Chloroflexota bacterium]MDE2895000.1 dihydroorotate dehydrogenase electron transfer subunit [Chloroflexota bacterium]